MSLVQLSAVCDGKTVGMSGATLKALGPLPVLTADPGSPDNDSAWILRSASSPYELTLKVRISSVTYSLPLGTINP